MPLPLRAELSARCLLLQSCWSFERMQSLGFAYALEPWLERCYRDPGERREALARHQDFFNTQPHMAPIVLGLVCGIEEELAALAPGERTALAQKVLGLKRAAAGALAGVGDALFWGALRLLAASLALVFGLLALRAGSPRATLAMPAVYLAVFNVPALAVRWKGLEWGYGWRERIAVKLQEFPWQAWIRRSRLAAGGLALIACGLMFGAPTLDRGQRGAGFVTLGVYLAAKSFLGARATAYRLYVATGLVGAAAAAAGWF